MSPEHSTPNLPAPAVPPEAYDATYYTVRCAGASEWSASGGRSVSGIYYGALARGGMRAGDTVVDIGTGRADLLVAALELGAARAYGIEYSPSAIELAKHTLEVHEAGDRAEVILADARAVPLEDGLADLVCLLDVAEHLTAPELHRALLEARRILKPGGCVIVHTMPNRLIYTVTYPTLRLLAGRRWPADPRNDDERLVHVNEQTRRGLQRALADAGLEAQVELGKWVYTDFVPAPWARRVYRGLARLGPLADLGVGDLWAIGRSDHA